MWFWKNKKFDGYDYPADLDALSDAELSEYQNQAKILRDNAVFRDLLKVLVLKYQKQIIEKVPTKKELRIARSWLKILDELQQMIDTGTRVKDVRDSGKGKRGKYLSR